VSFSSSLVVLPTTDDFVDLHPRTIQLPVSTDVAPTTNTLVFANQRSITLLMSVTKNLLYNQTAAKVLYVNWGFATAYPPPLLYPPRVE
jgi:hypothetical protein